MSVVNFIESAKYGNPSCQTLREFEHAIAEETDWTILASLPTRLSSLICKLSEMLPFLSNLLRLFRSDSSYLSVLMGISRIKQTSPWFLFNSNHRMIYLFDAFEPAYPIIEEIIINNNIDIVFFSAKQAADFFSKKLVNVMSFWIPEGILPSAYFYRAYEDKSVDILQFGRKYDYYHDKIIPFCEKQNITYLYEKTKGQIIFTTKEDFIEALACTKISICFPSNITHPERSGGISTMTQRYLQSMASKCLIVGIMPSDMKELFDYCPIIEADLEDPVGQIEEILNNFEKYVPLIERNYETLYEQHLWRHRIALIEDILEKEVFAT